MTELREIPDDCLLEAYGKALAMDEVFSCIPVEWEMGSGCTTNFRGIEIMAEAEYRTVPSYCECNHDGLAAAVTRGDVYGVIVCFVCYKPLERRTAPSLPQGWWRSGPATWDEKIKKLGDLIEAAQIDPEPQGNFYRKPRNMIGGTTPLMPPADENDLRVAHMQDRQAGRTRAQELFKQEYEQEYPDIQIVHPDFKLDPDANKMYCKHPHQSYIDLRPTPQLLSPSAAQQHADWLLDHTGYPE